MSEVVSFITHQFNAYEDDDGTIVADMTGSGSGKAAHEDSTYDVLSVENLLKEGGGLKEERMFRFRINPKTNSVKVSNILADTEMVNMEFPSYNRDYMEKKYNYGYNIQYPYKAGSKIVKIDLNARKIVAEFSAPGSRGKDAVFREPWFVSRPGSATEDDGVILVLAGDVSTKTTTLYVLDATSLEMIGQAEIPTFIPLGFHNRFYSSSDLGLDSDINNQDQYCESERAC